MARCLKIVLISPIDYSHGGKPMTLRPDGILSGDELSIDPDWYSQFEEKTREKRIFAVVPPNNQRTPESPFWVSLVDEDGKPICGLEYRGVPVSSFPETWFRKVFVGWSIMLDQLLSNRRYAEFIEKSIGKGNPTFEKFSRELKRRKIAEGSRF
ncbi:MAG: hypothetical protein AAB513_00600 [Patescibacteria group bacterium]